MAQMYGGASEITASKVDAALIDMHQQVQIDTSESARAVQEPVE